MNLGINNNYQCKTNFGCNIKPKNYDKIIREYYSLPNKRKEPTTFIEAFKQIMDDYACDMHKFTSWICKKLGMKKS